MTFRILLIGLLIAATGLTLGYVLWRTVLGPKPPSAEAVQNAYSKPLTAPEGAMNVYHLGHSLVGRDMPAMLEQLAPDGHSHSSQLGWGTSLREHWDPDLPINGFDTENDHANFRPAHEALASGAYDAVILTEMVELKDALKHHDSAKYLSLWVEKARAGNPRTRLYLYETWHRLDDPAGWNARIATDLPTLWEDQLLLQIPDILDEPIHVIPAGQALGRFVQAIEQRGGLDTIHDRTDLFARDTTGEVDQIHLNDLGNYLVALTHYSVLYHRSPVGLPFDLKRADGTLAQAPSPREAELMQKIVWGVVMSYSKTGVAP